MAVDRAGLPSSGCEALINGALEAEAPGSLQTRLTAAAIPLLRSPQCSPALALDAISCLVCPAADQRLNSALLLWYSSGKARWPGRSRSFSQRSDIGLADPEDEFTHAQRPV